MGCFGEGVYSVDTRAGFFATACQLWSQYWRRYKLHHNAHSQKSLEVLTSLMSLKGLLSKYGARYDIPFNVDDDGTIYDGGTTCDGERHDGETTCDEMNVSS